MADNPDLVIRGGSIADGLGGELFEADVAITRGRITEIGRVSGKGKEEIDARGKLVAPGFVDIHAHSDFTILSDPRARSAVRQGITTQVNGNCGMSPVPAPPARAGRADEVRLAVNTVDPDAAVKADWSTYAEYVRAVEAARPAINQAPLIGHITLKVFGGFVVMLGGLGFVGVLGAILPLGMTVALTALELLVAVLQAYVFAILTCLYLRDALHLH